MWQHVWDLLGLSQFFQNVAINAKGGDCWKYAQLIRISMFYGCHLWQHILFCRYPSMGFEGKLSKCWTVLHQVKYKWKKNIPFKYYNAQLTKDEGHHVDDVLECTSPNCLCSSIYEVNIDVDSVEQSIISIWVKWLQNYFS